MNEAINKQAGPVRKRHSKNLHLDPSIVALAVVIQTQDHRPSLSNVMEHLVMQEGKRRGLSVEERAA